MAAHQAKTKYRPYLTPSELDIIIDSLKVTGSNPHLIHYLSGFKGKIDLGITSPNLVTTPRPSVMERLGLSDPMDDLSNLTIIPKGISREEAYQKWVMYATKCTAKEIEQATIYRFENDLMSPEEETEYLSRIGV